jgi:hypothetical protein
MNRRIRKSILKDAKMPPQHVGEMVPPDIKPMVKEYHIGRNDMCPCDKNMELLSEYRDWEHIVLIDETYSDPVPEVLPKKYKDCCMNSGTYENYK